MYWHEIDRSGTGCVKEVHLSVVQLNVVDFVVTDVNAVLVDPKIKPDTVVPVSGHDVRQAMSAFQLPVLIVKQHFEDSRI